MNRLELLNRIRERKKPWDILIIGGGASGLGTAIDAASRGYDTLLLEKYDFAKGTSSRSTKLAHGGVRYLQQGDISLVFEALRERGLMRKNAPHLVRNLAFVIPNYEWWDGPFYTIGLKVYDMMAGKLGLGPSTSLSKEETIEAIPNVKQEGLRGGVIYHDGQFDDARLAVSMALTADDYDAAILNYCEVKSLTKSDNLITGVVAMDSETGEELNIESKVVINAAGVFADDIIHMDDPEARRMIMPSQGVHIVLDKEFLPGENAIMVPHTSDGRVLFAVPWHDKVVVGTTDTLVEIAKPEPVAHEDEIDFILETARQYLIGEPTRKDVRSVFAGLRPLAAPEGDEKPTKEISRHHKILISLSGLVTITGGKWTTYRKMAEDTVDNAVMVAGLPEKKCVTETLHIHGYSQNEWTDFYHVYGNEARKIKALIRKDPTLGEKLHPDLDYTRAQVVWAVREEMARTVEDVLARRTRALFLDAKAAIDAAPAVAETMVGELGQSRKWVQRQLDEFEKVAENYV